ncbi:MAG: ferritin-like domain-containing protein [Cyanobacteria bacterium J06632_22]
MPTQLQPCALSQPAPLSPHQLQHRIDALIDQYLPLAHLDERLADLPQQFANPQPRPWARIPWTAIDADQVLGIDTNIFLAILSGTINTEAPIRGYTQASRQYLTPLDARMAYFVGGQVDTTGQRLEPGLWEKEERRHTPALKRVYTQLSGVAPMVTPHSARPYRPTTQAEADLYRHGLHRVATEYGATCLYLWMMAHTTGPLQAVLAELLIDEINHTVKFWGFGRWAFPQASLFTTGQTVFSSLREKWHNPQVQGSLMHTLRRMTQTLHWSDWSFINQAALMYTFGKVMQRLLQWQNRLTPGQLRELLGEPITVKQP